MRPGRHQKRHFDMLVKLVFQHKCLILSRRILHRQTFSTLLCFSCRKLSDRSKALLILYEFLSVENEICVWVCVWQYLSRKQATEQFWSKTFSWQTFFFAEFRIQCFDFNEVFLSANRFSCSSYRWILNEVSLSHFLLFWILVPFQNLCEIHF